MTDPATAAIHAQARYIAVEQQEPGNAQRWLELAWDAVESLETMPKRCAIAEEDEDVDYEVRFILAGTKSLLLTIDEERQTVWVIALRGEGQLPKPEYLPQSLGAPEAERRIHALRQALVEAEESGDAGPFDMDEIIRAARRSAGLPDLDEE